MTNPDWLKTAARRGGQEPWTLGHVFEQYQRIEGQSPEGLAAELGCSLGVLQWLSLCRGPRAERFAGDVREVSQRFAVAPHRLAAVVRRVEVMAALARGPEEEESVRKGPLLLAARDRSPGEEPGS
ncbi:hypothetical protein [Stigmatella aurantiaca]|uniref:Conserved uncharacterized protein n=1 Tax=Stigmatella aurantiaca (strain DW4/3-1) TaxID=378806 RepID=Q099Y0_STIAD|nr:hypothetical protein [Stigmatella aurantiaca]ADO73058.1 conserved uncharacterized protein [Stigmatella aurantiaca DW4/3-1]EAU68540.1 hypothetical protein STIAU_7357 [Stigmatella aurantiaca DW4/3-1]